MHPASKDGKYQEFTSRVQTVDTEMLWDAYRRFYDQMKASGRPMPPLWRQPVIWGLFVKWLAADWYIAGRGNLETATQEVLVSIFVEVSRRMTVDSFHQAREILEDDEF